MGVRDGGRETLLFNVSGINRPDDYEDATMRPCAATPGFGGRNDGGRMPRLTGSGDLLFIRGKSCTVGFDQGRRTSTERRDR
jgi:hypothetical protein